MTGQNEIEDTLARLTEAWGRKDLDGVLTCFTGDAVYDASVGPTPGERAGGHSNIRILVSRMFAHDHSERSVTQDLTIHQNTATWKWRYELADGTFDLGCDFFTFEGGLIASKDAYRKVKTEITE